ncbi:unnamed protein product [Ectocarpus fasciculatus]
MAGIMNEDGLEGSLREAASRCGIARKKKVHVGAAIMPDYLNQHYDPYSAVLNREFNSVVVEHHMKWKPLLVGGDEGVYDFRPCDKIVDWAIDKGMEVKGHTLCWHVTTPDFAEDMSASRLREALYRHIRTTMGHFYGRVGSWDVVNEALCQDCSGRMEDNVFLRKLGPGYVDDCFRVAHQIDPNAKLIYNDNKAEGAGLPGGRSQKADAMYDMLKGMKERGVPVHGAGLQGHFTAAGTGMRRTPTPHSVQRQVRRLGDLGLTVNISEMDVRVAGLADGVDGETAQAAIYGDILEACLTEEAFDGLTLWGFTDLHSWVHNFYEPDSPLPWDKEFQPKGPVVGAMRDALLRTRAGSPVLATPEHLWGKDWMVPEPANDGAAGAGGHAGGAGEGGGAVDAPNWNARNDH